MIDEKIILKIIQKEKIVFERETIKELENFSFIGFVNDKNNSIIKTNELSGSLSFEKKCNCIFLRNPFNHTENFRELFVEINRVLKNQGLLICLFDNQNSIKKPRKWQEMYLKRLCKMIGFRELDLSLGERFQIGSFQRKTKNIVLAVKKISNVSETYSKKCDKCRKPLGKKWKFNKETNEYFHEICPS